MPITQSIPTYSLLDLELKSKTFLKSHQQISVLCHHSSSFPSFCWRPWWWERLTIQDFMQTWCEISTDMWDINPRNAVDNVCLLHWLSISRWYDIRVTFMSRVSGFTCVILPPEWTFQSILFLNTNRLRLSLLTAHSWFQHWISTESLNRSKKTVDS